MPFDVISRVVVEASKHGLREIIPSTMGEPLLYERFDDILALCRRYDVKLNLTTNGSFPGLGATAWAEKIVPVASDVKISWNGATRETYEAIMRRGRFDAALEGVGRFVAVRDRVADEGGNRCQVSLQVTFLETNLHELPDIVRLAGRLGVDRVKGHHVWTHYPELEQLSMRRSNEAKGRWNEVVQECRAAAEASSLPGGERVRLENFFELSPGANGDAVSDGHCPFLGREAWINTEGRFDPCCAPDELRQGLGSFGHVEDEGLMAIWNGEAYRTLLSTWREKPLCRDCAMRRPVGGHP